VLSLPPAKPLRILMVGIGVAAAGAAVQAQVYWVLYSAQRSSVQ
jgi:hypothetical protein